MARVLFALELGGELGHVRACSALGSALAARGHEIALVLSELHSPQAVTMRSRHELLRVPLARTGPLLERPASYAEILIGCGYREAAALAPVAEAWRRHLQAWKPDLVVADFAPTAMLAARALGIACANYGIGFTIPPRVDPLPSFRFDEAVRPDRIPGANATALEAANSVLRSWGAQPLERLSGLLECEQEFLCTWPELDHYGNRPASGYWGPRFEVDSGARAAWPAGRGKRIFLYLKTALRQLDAVTELLAASAHRVIAFIPGLDASRQARLRGPARQVSLEPLKLEPLLADCDLALTHGGQLTAGLATCGIPQLVFPLQFEQYITARRIEQAGCGLWLGPGAKAAHVAAAIRELLSNPSRAAAARAFSRRYPGFTLAEQRRRIVARIEEIAAHRRAGPILAASPNKEKRP